MVGRAGFSAHAASETIASSPYTESRDGDWHVSGTLLPTNQLPSTNRAIFIIL